MDKWNRASAKWGHPEIVQENFYTISRPEFFYTIDTQTDADRKVLRDALRAPVAEAIKVTPDFAERTWEDYYTEHGCPEEPNAPAAHIVVSRPKDMRPKEKLPVVFGICGGGLTYGGTAELPMSLIGQLVRYSGKRVIIVTTEYRIAPESQYPKAINDIHAGYLWMLEHAEKLQINKKKIILWGQSTGGQLVLCTTFRLKRYDWCGAPRPRGVIAQVPVMDDVAYNQSNHYKFEEEKDTELWAWNPNIARQGMRYWLGEQYGNPDLPPEAVPSRATVEDVKGFPPVWFPSEAEFDPGRDSVYKFISLLHEAGIFCDLHMWGGTTHQFNAAEGTDFAERFQRVAGGALRDAIEFDFGRSWLDE